MSGKKSADFLRERKRQLEEDEKKKKRKSRIIKISVIASVLVFAILITSVILNIYTASNKYLKKYVALESENYKITSAMLSYYFYDGFHEFINLYGDNHERFGVKKDVALKKQTFYGEEYNNWHEYFLDSAKNQVKDFMELAEGAIAEGVSLTEEEKESIKIKAERIDMSKYPSSTVDDVVYCLELNALALKYKEMLKNGFMPSDEAFAKELQDNFEKYTFVDYRKYEFSFDISGVSGPTKDEAKQFVEELKASQSGEEFDIRLESFIDENFDYTEEEKREIIEKTVFEKVERVHEDDVSAWFFDGERADGDARSYTDDENSKMTVYYITRAPYLDHSETRIVRHILFREDTYGSYEAAYEKAEEVSRLLEQKGNSEQAFSELALAYSEDAGSLYNGGLYEGFSKDDMMPEFSDWSFDKQRQTGDIGIVKTDYGYHIIYYIGAGQTKYVYEISTGCAGYKLGTKYVYLEADAQVKVNSENCNKVK